MLCRGAVLRDLARRLTERNAMNAELLRSGTGRGRGDRLSLGGLGRQHAVKGGDQHVQCGTAVRQKIAHADSSREVVSGRDSIPYTEMWDGE